MHKERFLQWCKDVYIIPPEDALNWWGDMERNYDKEDEDQVDKFGPKFSPLQLAIPTHSCTDGSETEKHTKRMQLMTKLQKIKDQGDLDSMAKEVSENHATFADKLHEKTGGKLMVQIAKMGHSNLSNASGAAALSGGGVNAGFGTDVVVDQKEEKAKKPKRFQVDTHVAKLLDTITTMMGNVLDTAKNVKQKSIESIKVANDVMESMPGVKVWLNILDGRCEWLDSVMYLAELADNADGTCCMDLPEYMFLVAAAETVNVQRLRTDPAALVDFAGIVALGKKECFDGSWVEAVYKKFTWYGSSFAEEPALSDLSSQLELMRQVFISVFKHDRFKQKEAERGRPAPVQDPTNLEAISGFHHMLLCALACESEHDVKHVTFPIPFLRSRLGGARCSPEWRSHCFYLLVTYNSILSPIRVGVIWI